MNPLYTALAVLLAPLTLSLVGRIVGSTIFMVNPFRYAASRVSGTRYPISGLDFRFLAQCNACDDYTGFTSVRGGELYQCNACGDRTAKFGFDDKQIKSMRLSSWSFWRTWKMIPYDWHRMSEKRKETFLGHK